MWWFFCRSVRPFGLYPVKTISISGFGENTNKKHSGARSFRNTAPTLWNGSPDTVHKAEVFSAAVEIIHVFTFLVTHPFPHPLPRIPLFTIFSKLNERVTVCMELNCAIQGDTDIDNRSHMSRTVYVVTNQVICPGQCRAAQKNTPVQDSRLQIYTTQATENESLTFVTAGFRSVPPTVSLNSSSVIAS